MISALWTAATGMNSQQTNIDVISNNLSNVNTSGFKKTRVNFADLMYSEIKQPGTPNTRGAQIPVGIEVGHGAKVNSTQKMFTPGNVQNTDNSLDFLIEGDGFFRVLRPDGSYAYTRDGSFKRDSTGQVVTADGYTLSPQIVIPEESTSISVTSDGAVNVKNPDGTVQQIGEIELYRFANPAGLISEGRNQFVTSSASGDPRAGVPGEEGYGTISQGFLEMSNVKVVEEMVNMIAAQRAYEVNSKAITAADEMLQTANQLRR